VVSGRLLASSSWCDWPTGLGWRLPRWVRCFPLKWLLELIPIFVCFWRCKRCSGILSLKSGLFVSYPRIIYALSSEGVIGGLAFLFYLATLSANYTGDSFEFALTIESTKLPAMIDPFHLLLHPLGWSFYKLWQLAGWSGKAMLPLQVLNALGGAACVGLMVGIVKRLTGSALVAMTVAVGFAVSFGIWLLSTQAEFVTIPLAVALWFLGVLFAASPQQLSLSKTAIALGLGTAFAALTYLTNLFLVPVTVAGYLLSSRQVWKTQLWQIALYLITAGLATLAVHSLTTWLVYGSRGLIGLPHLFSGGGVYGQLEWKNAPQGIYAFLRTLAGYPNLVMNDNTLVYLAGAAWSERIVFAGYYALVWVLAAAPLCLAWINRQELLRAHRRSLGMLGVWTLLYAAFGFYWVPGDVTFWVPVLAAWWIVVGMVLALLLARARARQASMPGFCWAAYWPFGALVGAVVLLGAINAFGVILPDHLPANNRWYQIADSVTQRTFAGDLVITHGSDRLPIYITYLAERHTFPLPIQKDVSTNQFFMLLNQEIDRTRLSGGRIYLVEIQPRQDAAVQGFTGGNRGHLEFAWGIEGATVWELLP